MSILLPTRRQLLRRLLKLRLAILSLFLTILGILLMTKSALDHSVQDWGGCKMTYSSPKYYPVKMNESDYEGYFGNYQLYLLQDGRYDLGANKLYGTPTLFLHGNAGSKVQIRSLGKVTSQLAHERNLEALDFFTIDFDEELSALSGQLLINQAEYVNRCIAIILDLYKNPGYYHHHHSSSSSSHQPLPTSVLLIGHSMGGIVARTIYLLPNYLEGSVNTILTLSSPHLAPRLPLDRGMSEVYERMNGYWRREHWKIKRGDPSPLSEVSLISVTGGNMDSQINADLTEVATIISPRHGFTVFSTTLPNGWLTTDHLCILWCNQIVKVLAHTLLDIISVASPQRTLPLPERMEVFNQRLLGSPVPTPPTVLTPIPSDYLVYPTDNFTSIPYHDVMIPVDALERPITHLIARGVTQLYSCQKRDDSGGSHCQEITTKSTSLPTTHHMKDENFGFTSYRFWSIHKQDYLPHSFLYLRFIKDPNVKRFISFMETPQEDTDIEVTPTLWDLLTGVHYDLPRPALGRGGDNPTPSLYYRWHFRLPDSSILAYKLSLENTRPDSDSDTSVIIRQASRVMHESKSWVTSTRSPPLFINFHGLLHFPHQDPSPHAPPPPSPIWKGVYFRAFIGLPIDTQVSSLNLQDSFRLTFRLDPYGTLGRLFKRVDIAVLAFPHGIALLVIRHQFQIFQLRGYPISFINSLQKFFRSHLGLWMVIGLIVAVIQNLFAKSFSLLEEYHYNPFLLFFYARPESWFVGNLGLIVSWVVPLLIFLSVGLTVAYHLLLTIWITLHTVITSWIPGHSGTVPEGSPSRWSSLRLPLLLISAVAIFLIPHPFIYLLSLIILVHRNPSQDSNKVMNLADHLHISICHLLLSSSLTYIPWLIVYIRGWLAGVKVIPFRTTYPLGSDTGLSAAYSLGSDNGLSAAHSLPLLLYIFFPPTTAQLQSLGNSPHLRHLTSLGLLLLAVTCLLLGVSYTYLLPELTLIVVTWLWVTCHLLFPSPSSSLSPTSNPSSSAPTPTHHPTTVDDD